MFRCGVDIVGPSNLVTLLKTIPPYWEAGKQQFYQRMGNPTTEDGKALLHERSPLFLADKIRVPLLIGQGANDPRVNMRESEQIVDAMKGKDIPVTYVVFPDEGHGFARPVNNIAFNAITENFLASCLGGRAERIGDAVKASTAEVREGAAGVPGLGAALKTGLTERTRRSVQRARGLSSFSRPVLPRPLWSDGLSTCEHVHQRRDLLRPAGWRFHVVGSERQGEQVHACPASGRSFAPADSLRSRRAGHRGSTLRSRCGLARRRRPSGRRPWRRPLAAARGASSGRPRSDAQHGRG